MSLKSLTQIPFSEDVQPLNVTLNDIPQPDENLEMEQYLVEETIEMMEKQLIKLKTLKNKKTKTKNCFLPFDDEKSFLQNVNSEKNSNFLGKRIRKDKFNCKLKKKIQSKAKSPRNMVKNILEDSFNLFQSSQSDDSSSGVDESTNVNLFFQFINPFQNHQKFQPGKQMSFIINRAIDPPNCNFKQFKKEINVLSHKFDGENYEEVCLPVSEHCKKFFEKNKNISLQKIAKNLQKYFDLFKLFSACLKSIDCNCGPKDHCLLGLLSRFVYWERINEIRPQSRKNKKLQFLLDNRDIPHASSLSFLTSFRTKYHKNFTPVMILTMCSLAMIFKNDQFNCHLKFSGDNISDSRTCLRYKITKVICGLDYTLVL